MEKTQLQMTSNSQYTYKHLTNSLMDKIKERLELHAITIPKTETNKFMKEHRR